MRGLIAAAAGLLPMAVGLVLGVQLSLVLSALGGTVHTPWGPVPLGVATSAACALLAGGISAIFAATALPRLQAFMKGAGKLRLARDLSPLAGVGVGIGLIAGVGLLPGPLPMEEAAWWIQPAAPLSTSSGEYDQRLNQMEARLLRAMPKSEADCPEAAACPEATETSLACVAEGQRVLKARRDWVRDHLQGIELRCEEADSLPPLGFDTGSQGTVLLNKDLVCDPTAPFGFELLSDSYVECHIQPSERTRAALVALRAAVDLGRIESIEFVGHTDDARVKDKRKGCLAEDRKTRVADNWHLSALRADRARAAFNTGTGPDLPSSSKETQQPVEITARAVGVQHESSLKRAEGESTEDWRARNRRVTVSITGSQELNFNTNRCLPTPAARP